jgi:hypothetical protein
MYVDKFLKWCNFYLEKFLALETYYDSGIRRISIPNLTSRTHFVESAPRLPLRLGGETRRSEGRVPFKKIAAKGF